MFDLPKLYWTVWVGTLINRAGGFVLPLLTFYLTREQHLSLGEAGTIVSLYGVGAVVSGLVGGMLADHLGRRATMVVSLLGGSVLMTALGLVQSSAAIAAITPLVGFVGELYRPAVGAFIADVVPAEKRLVAFSNLHWAVNIGFSIAPIAAGLVAGWSYRALFLGDAATTAIYGVIILLFVPETRPAASAHHDAPRVRLADIVRDRAFVTFWFATFVVALIMFQSTSTLSGWMSSQHHDERVYGFVIAVNGILIVALQPLLSRRLRAADPLRVLAIAALISGAGMALHGASSLIAIHVLAVMIWTFGEIASAPTASAVVADLAPPSARGRYQGVYTMSFGLASFAGPLAGTRVLERFGPTALFGGCLVLGVIAAIGYLLPTLPRRPTASPTP